MDRKANYHGTIFTGDPKRVKFDGYYNSNGGNVDCLPDYECTGGSSIPSDHNCPHVLRRDGDVEENDGNESSSSNIHNSRNNNSSMGPSTSSGWDGRLLHVNMPSYRDPLCPRTLLNLFTKSKRPNDIRVRILQQNVPEEDDHCLEKYCEMMMDIMKMEGEYAACPHRDQVYVHEIHVRDAAGPTYARGLIGKDMMWNAYLDNEIGPQDFCMSTDSHMDYEPDWDDGMVEMWDMTRNEYGILSTYVANIEQLRKSLNGRHEVPHLCMVIFTSQVRTHATKCAYELSRPKLTNAVLGGGSMLLEVPRRTEGPGRSAHARDVRRRGIQSRISLASGRTGTTYTPPIGCAFGTIILESQHDPKTSSWGAGKSVRRMPGMPITGCIRCWTYPVARWTSRRQGD